jgi:hypothetical protein
MNSTLLLPPPDPELTSAYPTYDARRKLISRQVLARLKKL